MQFVGQAITALSVIWQADVDPQFQGLPVHVLNVTVDFKEELPSGSGILIDIVPIHAAKLQIDSQDRYWPPDGQRVEFLTKWGGDSSLEGWQGIEGRALINGERAELLPPYSTDDVYYLARELHRYGCRVYGKIEAVNQALFDIRLQGYMLIREWLTYFDPKGDALTIPSYFEYRGARVNEPDWTTRILLDNTDTFGAFGLTVAPYEEILAMVKGPTTLDVVQTDPDVIGELRGDTHA